MCIMRLVTEFWVNIVVARLNQILALARIKATKACLIYAATKVARFGPFSLVFALAHFIWRECNLVRCASESNADRGRGKYE